MLPPRPRQGTERHAIKLVNVSHKTRKGERRHTAEMNLSWRILNVELVSVRNNPHQPHVSQVHLR